MKQIDQDAKIINFVKERLLLEEEEFPKGINEYIVICRAWEIDSTEKPVRDTISYLIDIGNIDMIRTDYKGIRYIMWKKIRIT